MPLSSGMVIYGDACLMLRELNILKKTKKPRLNFCCNNEAVTILTVGASSVEEFLLFVTEP